MLGLLHSTDPGSALGGRPNSGLIPPKKVEKSAEGEAESNQLSSKGRVKPALLYVYLERNQTGVSSLGHFEDDIRLNSGGTKHEKDSGLEGYVQSDGLFGEAEDPIGAVKLTAAAQTIGLCATDQSNVTSYAEKQKFPSVAANNYYNAIQQLNASKRNSFVEASKRKSSMENRNSLIEVESRDRLKTSGGNQKNRTKKKGKKLTLEQLVAKALSVPFTPEERARYSLAQDDEKHYGSDDKNSLHDSALYNDEEPSLTTEIIPSPAVVSPIACPPVASFDNNGSDDKNSLHDDTLYKDEEPSLTTDIVPSPALVSPIACPPVASFDKFGSVEKNSLHDGILYKDEELSVATEIVPSPAIVPPIACPPVASFDNYTVKTELVSSPAVLLPAAHPPVASFGSFNIETKQSTLSGASSITNHSSCDGNTITAKDASLVEKYANQKGSEYCPRISEIPSSDRCPEIDHLVYPELDDEFNMVDTPREIELSYTAPTSNEKNVDPVTEESIEEVLEAYLTKTTNLTACLGNLREESKIGSKPPLIDPITHALRVNDVLSPIGVVPVLGKIRSESPSFFKKMKKIETVRKDEVKTSSSTIKNALRSARSMSPSFLLPPKSDAKPTSKSSSDCSTATASTGSASDETAPRIILLPPFANDGVNHIEDIISVPVTKSNTKRNSKPMLPSQKDTLSQSRSSALPPRIPSRGGSCALPRQHLQQIDTNPADDGSVECSVMKNEEILQLTEGGDAAVASLCDGLNNGEITPEEMNPHSDVTFEKKKGSGDDVIAEVLTPIKSGTSTVACVAIANEKSEFYHVSPRNELAALSNDEDNNATISSSAGSQKMKEKLKKIMDYRKIAEVSNPTKKLSKGASSQNNKNTNEIEISKTELSFFPEGEAEKSLQNAQHIDRILKENWSAPVQRIDVLPNALDYDDADDDVSLPPELESSKIKIWQEDASNDSETSLAENGRDTKLVVDSYVMYREISRTDTDVFDGIHADNNTIIANTVCDDNESTGCETKYDGRFSCGIEAQELKDEIIFEVKDFVNDIKVGVQQGLQKLFLTCDITRDGGVEYLRTNVGLASDQLFGRAPMPSASSMQKSIPPCVADAASQNIEKETGHTQSAVSNKQKLYVARLKELSLKHV
jgi:hypothetical protein